MEKNLLVNFPYPYKLNKEHFDGFNIFWLSFCKSCSYNHCQYQDTKLHTCPRGLSYRWVNKNLMIGGVIVRNQTPIGYSVSSTLRKTNKKNIVSKEDIDKAIENILSIENLYAALEKETIERIIKEKTKEILNSREIKDTITNSIQEYTRSMHDVKQFISTVIQNIHCIMQKYNKSTDDDNVEAASHYEKAIYYSCKMMEAKIQTLSYINNINKISDTEFSYTEIHKLILKIVKIYKSLFDERNIHIAISNSFFKIYTHFNAISIIPHAIIDNALKYSPENSTFNISFDEDEHNIIIRFESLGPKILSDEKNKIFEPAVRGKYAQKVSHEGLGFGLYAAALIADKLNSSIAVEQFEEDIIHKNYYKTVFTVSFFKI